jgi:dTDP-4-dehydrorhamnose reductase
LREGRSFTAASDQVISPTYLPRLVDRVLDLLIDGETGISTSPMTTALSWADFARRIAAACGLDPGLISGASGAGLTPAPRPRQRSAAE